MMVYIDSSAFYSLLNTREHNHATSTTIWRNLLLEDRPLLTSNYAVLESTALLQNRLGMAAVSDFIDNVLPLVAVTWIDQELHETAVSAFLAARRRKLSLVDCVGVEVCRRKSIVDVFAFDKHFVEQGFYPLSP